MFRVPPLYRARLLAAGIDFADRHGNHAWTLPVPAMFLLDRDGKVAWRFVDVDFTRRATPALILSALRTLTGSG